MKGEPILILAIKRVSESLEAGEHLEKKQQQTNKKTDDLRSKEMFKWEDRFYIVCFEIFKGENYAIFSFAT